MKRRMIHPGPRAAQRVQLRQASLVPVVGTLHAGLTVMQAVGDLFATHGCRGGMIRLDGVICDPLRYVLPAPSSNEIHAAWYSDTMAPVGPWVIDRATATTGLKDGTRFLHCHGVWSGNDKTAMGHLLPFACIVAEEVTVSGLGAAGTWFEALPDEETAFTLFTPEGGEDGPDLFVRILPGEDVVTTIEKIASDHGIRNACLHAIGSIDHIHFTEGHSVDCFATELHFNNATLTDGQADIPIEAVDIDGQIHRGRLTRGNNPVGVTFELIIETKGQQA